MLAAPEPGTRIAGKYEVERVLGQGGMGIVVAARHLVTANRVAIKFLLAEALDSPSVIQRFINEARAAVQIQSEHVARVIDVDTMPNGLPYMVMELLDGNDLSHEIARRMSLSPQTAVAYALQALEALAEAHALGIVHRDLKPANLFLTKRRDGSPLVKVLDFGISKITNPLTQGDSQQNKLTRTGTVLGSPLYMSPEQLTSAKGVDARSDIWSLGVVLYEMLSGQLPFNDETLGGLVVRIATQPPFDLRSMSSGIPEGLVTVVERCLQKDPAHRFQNVAELAQALAPFAPQSAQLSVERVSRVMDGSMPPSEPLPPYVHTPQPAPQAPRSPTLGAFAGTQSDPIVLPVQRSKLGLVAAGAVLAVAALGTAVFFVTQKGDPSPTPPGAPAKVAVAPESSAAPAAASSSQAPVVTPATSQAASPDSLPTATASGTKGKPAAKPGKGDARPPDPPPAAPPPPTTPAQPKKPTGPADFGGK